jgi:hypothetical protein
VGGHAAALVSQKRSSEKAPGLAGAVSSAKEPGACPQPSKRSSPQSGIGRRHGDGGLDSRALTPFNGKSAGRASTLSRRAELTVLRLR